MQRNKLLVAVYFYAPFAFCSVRLTDWMETEIETHAKCNSHSLSERQWLYSIKKSRYHNCYVAKSTTISNIHTSCTHAAYSTKMVTTATGGMPFSFVFVCFVSQWKTHVSNTHAHTNVCVYLLTPFASFHHTSSNASSLSLYLSFQAASFSFSCNSIIHAVHANHNECTQQTQTMATQSWKDTHKIRDSLASIFIAFFVCFMAHRSQQCHKSTLKHHLACALACTATKLLTTQTLLGIPSAQWNHILILQWNGLLTTKMCVWLATNKLNSIACSWEFNLTFFMRQHVRNIPRIERQCEVSVWSCLNWIWKLQWYSYVKIRSSNRIHKVS